MLMKMSTISLTSVNIHKANWVGPKEHQWNPTHWMDIFICRTFPTAGLVMPPSLNVTLKIKEKL